MEAAPAPVPEDDPTRCAMSWDHSHAAVLRTACANAVRLRQAALAPISVAINLSARQFEMKDFAKRVGCILEAAALESQNLRLELTETMVMSNPDESRAILGELGAMGISLALDDFGTGYSSLRFLQQFPLHCLKIDRSFVSAVPADERSEAITRAVVALGKALHMRVVAEGVENHAQLDFLQGYLLSTPLPYDQLVKWLADRTPINDAENPLGATVLPMCPEMN